MGNQTAFHLLKPDLRSGFLNGGKGQQVNYLQINPRFDLDTLAEDIENGKKQYQELYEFAKKKKNSRFVVIDAESEEEGLMAVSYLAAINNKKEKEIDFDMDLPYLEEEEDIDIDDFDNISDLGFGEDDEDDWEEDMEWEENPFMTPIVNLEEICDSYSGFDPFSSGDRDFMATSRPRGDVPFWHYTRREPIIIMNHVVFWNSGANITAKLKRFEKNRHVYMINVHNKEEHPFVVTSDARIDAEQQDMCMVILEYSAATVKIKMDLAEREQYYQALLKDYVALNNRKLCKGFPIEDICKRIVAIKEPAKSSLIDKVVKYVVLDENVGKTLKAEDFNILDRFKALGVFDAEKKVGINNLDDRLIGLDNVKEQMRGIVEVMKYQKRRESMGLPKGDYHNVHMLLGAPGTAKTTVAQMLGDIMAEEKLLAHNRFISVNGAELKGMYVGHSAPKVKAIFDKYDVILIDEAYSVAASDNGGVDSFSQEAIAQLIIELEKHGMDRLVLFAGYGGDKMNEKDNKMRKFLEANPGIRSRINSTVLFESYSPETMVEIFVNHASRCEYTVEEGVRAAILEFFKKRVKDSDFGNGREARSLLENATMEVAKRLATIPDSKITKEMLSEIKLIDIENAIDRAQTGYLAQKAQKVSNIGFMV